jgi:glycosyltransferase involved in cell wall biosynthesis
VRQGAPRVGVVGPLLEEHEGWVESPGRRLADLLVSDGLAVRTTSRHVGRIRRSVDVASTAVRWRHQVDVVVVMVFSGPALRLSEVGLRCARAAGARTVAWLHGGGLPEQAEHDAAVDRVVGGADQVVAPSPWLARWAERRGHAADVVPNVVLGPGTPFRTRRPLQPRVLWMRTYHDLYDPLLAVEAFTHLAAARPDARMTMAGQDRGLRQQVVDEVQRRGLGEQVTVEGFAADEHKAELFAEHDVLLCTNRVDNAPVTVVEAGRAGLPVVARAVGGLPDLLEHGAGGVLVDGRSPQALAGAVVALLDEPQRADGIVAAGRRRAEAHTWGQVGPRWHELLQELADG